MRVAVGVCFFAVDRHEVILPEVPRKVIDRYQRERREPTAEESRRALAEARDLGLFGWKVGSEIDLPTRIVNYHPLLPRDGEHRELSCGHIRRGHMAMVACGRERKERRLVFRAPVPVRPDLPLRSTHGYRVRIT